MWADEEHKGTEKGGGKWKWRKKSDGKFDTDN